ncbi:MAG TPA: GMP reductase [Candidatus Paceibacterota bacterium]|nr:GMP reductase [Candidatus Paceibacterota bacterium]
MRIEEDVKLDYADVLIRPKRSTLTSRKDVVLEREFNFYHSKKTWKGIPIMTSNMATCGTFEMAKVLSKYKIITTFHKYYKVEDYKKFFQEFNDPDFVSYTLGIRDEDIAQLKEMIANNLINNFSFICIDVPNGYLERFEDAIKLVRSLCPDHIIIAGNVVTNEMTEQIILSGADIVKIGIGPGSACTTRRMTGVGYPQLSAVIECADAAHGISNGQGGHGLVIADGGQQYPSCVAKAFCGGADFNMFGSMFSGFDESAGEIIEKDGKKFKEYFGSSSNKALLEFYGKKGNYRASEGRHVLMPYKGPIDNFLQDLLGSLRSTGTYIGAMRLKDFPRRATFIKVNRQLTTYLEKYDLGD